MRVAPDAADDRRLPANRRSDVEIGRAIKNLGSSQVRHGGSWILSRTTVTVDHRIAFGSKNVGISQDFVESGGKVEVRIVVLNECDGVCRVAPNKPGMVELP